MLLNLAGKKHFVITGVLVNNWKSGRCIKEVYFYQKSMVEFYAFTEQYIEHYLATSDSLDKAGGYGIQSAGRILIKKVEGSLTNVIGLPTWETY